MEKQVVNEKDYDLLLKYGLHDINLKDAMHISFKQGEYIFREGEHIKYIYFVISGKAKVFLNLSNGKRLLLSYFISNGVFGDMALVTNSHTAFTTMQAVTEFACIGLPLTSYAGVLKNNVTFINYIAGELAEKLIQRGINGTITTLQPLENKLCAYIIQMENNGIFRETLTEVAELVGASYRHLLRCLDKLCNNEILRKEPYGYRILNPQALSEKAVDLYVLK